MPSGVNILYRIKKQIYFGFMVWSMNECLLTFINFFDILFISLIYATLRWRTWLIDIRQIIAYFGA